MNEKVTKERESFILPLRRVEIKLEDLQYGDGMKMLQLKIREGKRFTVLELDPGSARHWGEAMVAWADSVEAEETK